MAADRQFQRCWWIWFSGTENSWRRNWSPNEPIEPSASVGFTHHRSRHGIDAHRAHCLHAGDVQTEKSAQAQTDQTIKPIVMLEGASRLKRRNGGGGFGRPGWS